jgi:secreted trypsin-like serine protease
VRHFPTVITCLLCALLDASCGPVDDGDVMRGARRGAITNGQLYSGHPSVGYLVTGGNELCTATLVGKKTLLTAAHCITVGQSHVFHLDTGATYAAAYVIPHPQWDPDPQVLANDIAIIILASEPPITPSIIARQAPSVGLKITIIGYGTSGEALKDAPIKRIATNTIKDLTATRFSVAGTGGGVGNTCHGDSGGPEFATLEGKEVQVGVTSAGVTPCGTLGYDTRVDAYTTWLNASAGGDLYDGVVADTEQPKVSITSPAANATVDTSLTVAVSATDNVGVVGVECFVDGTSVGTASNLPYQFAATLADGTHQIRAVARDKAGNEGESTISVVAKPGAPSPVPGEFGSPCTDNAACQGNLCGLDTATQQRFCTQTCDPQQQGSCPLGATCFSAGSSNLCGPPRNDLAGDTLVGGCAVAPCAAGDAGLVALLAALALLATVGLARRSAVTPPSP